MAGSGVSAAWAKRAVAAALQAEKASRRTVTVLLTGDAEIRRVHREHMDDDTPTDVISFPIDAKSPEGKSGYLGDVVASFDTARRVSRELGIPYREELARYLVHGTLHLLGYDDMKPADKKKMHARQEIIVSKLFAKRKAK